jgi:glycosyltransferase involved in cell wall biosynthesis
MIDLRAMPRLLLADRVKQPSDSFLAPLLPALSRRFDVKLVSLAPGEELAAAVQWADIVWLEWCWDHAVWVTRSQILAGRPCILRLHSIEALQTDYPSRIDWSQIDHLVTVAEDLTEVLGTILPGLLNTVPVSIISNGIDLQRFVPGTPDRYHVGWVGHLEPKKDPMLLLQIAHQLHQSDPRYKISVAGAFTDLRTARYLQHLMPRLGLAGVVQFDGVVQGMPAWYADKGVLLSTSMYESFGMNIGEAMATGAYPVIHAFPGAERLWPPECLFTTIDQAVAQIRSARPGLYRDWVAARYSLERQVASVISLLDRAYPRVAAWVDLA